MKLSRVSIFLEYVEKNLVKSPARILRSQKGVVLFVREKKAPFLQPNRNEPLLFRLQL